MSGPAGSFDLPLTKPKIGKLGSGCVPIGFRVFRCCGPPGLRTVTPEDSYNYNPCTMFRVFRFSAGSPCEPLQPEDSDNPIDRTRFGGGRESRKKQSGPHPNSGKQTSGQRNPGHRQRSPPRGDCSPQDPPLPPDVIKVRSAFPRGVFCSGLPIRHDPPLRRVLNETADKNGVKRQRLPQEN